MIAAIRISGMIKLRSEIQETLFRLRLRKKYTCVILNEKNPQTLGMIKDIKDCIAFGTIDEKTLVSLIKARGKKIGDKGAKVEHPEKIAAEILAGKNMEDLGIKPFFGLHPPRGGINTKLHFPRGVIGNHKEAINKLITRML